MARLDSVLIRNGGLQITSTGDWHAGYKKGLHVNATQGNEGVASNHPHILWRFVAERGIILVQFLTISVLIFTLFSNAYIDWLPVVRG